MNEKWKNSQGKMHGHTREGELVCQEDRNEEAATLSLLPTLT